MSKTDALRAIKQARLEAQRSAAPAATTVRAPATKVKPAATTPTTAPTAAPPSADLVPEELCGHTAISGRRCTRPRGHAEKNHRYAA